MFTVGEAFDLLFGAIDPPLSRVSFSDRRWFRKPRPHNQTADEYAKWSRGADRAENLLLGKVLSCLDRWSRNLEGVVKDGERISDSDPSLGASFPQLQGARHLPPRMPYDVFAAAAYLIDQGGIYHHIQPAKAEFASRRCDRGVGGHIRNSPRHVEISDDDRRQAIRTATAWRNLPRSAFFSALDVAELADHMIRPDVWSDLEPLFESWAIVFGAYANANVFLRLSTHAVEAEPAPAWWKHVWRLFATADEAAKGTAFEFDSMTLQNPMAEKEPGRPWFEHEYFRETAIQMIRRRQGGPFVGRPNHYALTSLSVARPEIISVLPKVRTPAVGCTLRSLSHHLAITPGQGVARGRWTPNFVRPVNADQLLPDGQMNILIIPYPFTISADVFCGSVAELPQAGDKAEQSGRITPRYGYFDVHQRWMQPPAGWMPSAEEPTWHDHFLKFTIAVLSAARQHSPIIHAIAFPELALDHDAYEKLREHLQDSERDVELLIAGMSGKRSDWRRAGTLEDDKDTDEEPTQHGNFVAVVAFNRSDNKADGQRESVREKHHRWKLDRAQLGSYGLTGVLSPEMHWWENIPLQSRRVDFSVIRQRSVVAALICEDLARVDPCQQIIRAVAPNLTVALLMDAPQKATRWPARYATVLAEDPGTAVLTITSRALMARQDRLGIYPGNGSNRIVAMWRDDREDAPLELNCPYDAQGLVLSVVEEPAEDVSLDGRCDAGAMAFRYAGHAPVRITDPGARAAFASILSESQ